MSRRGVIQADLSYRWRPVVDIMPLLRVVFVVKAGRVCKNAGKRQAP